MSHSQGKEDEMIERFFAGKTDGFFVDIGAGDGINLSNTRQLWERGWRGVLVEASPQNYAALVANYDGSNRVTLVNAAIGSRDGVVDFWEHSISGWNTTDIRWVSQQGGFAKRRVLGLRLETLHLPNEIDLLSIDTEGKDAEILASMPVGFRPKLILAEIDKFDNAALINHCLTSRGYRRHWDNGSNAAYCL